MIIYYLSDALRSIKRNPGLSFLVVAAIAVGIGVYITMLSLYYVMGSNPIRHKNNLLYAVQLDSWNPLRPFNDDKPERAPHQMTWRDATALLRTSNGNRQVAMFESRVVLQTEGSDAPFEADTRVTSADFFPMFDVPFVFGGGWGQTEDENADQVIVLGQKVNQRLFGGENSVGKNIIVNNRIFTVSGVMDHWQPVPRFYDVINGPVNEVSEVFVPFSLTAPMEIRSYGSDWGWKAEDINSFADFLNSESAWIQYWAELDTDAARDAYRAHLDAYATEQKKAGRFGRPLNNSIHTVSQWLEYHEVVRQDVRVLLGLGFLFLVVCLLSSISLLLTKFTSRTPEMSLRRALGANRAQIVQQNLTEVALLGAMGGLLGILFTQWSLSAIQRGVGENAPAALFELDWVMLAAAIFVAIATSLLAGIYPAIRACLIAPAHQLKTQ